MFGSFKNKQPQPNDLTHQVVNSISSLLSENYRGQTTIFNG